MVRKAHVRDVPEIQRLVNYFAEKDQMLPRSLNTIYETLRDFFVIENNGKVVGCCALHITWGDLAEIKSLAVDETHQGSGFGRLLVEACLGEARQLGIPRVFCLTYVPEFFEKLGFSRVDKSHLPHKIWSECINCHKFPNCGEEALVLEL